MADAVWLSDELREETRKHPIEVRMAFYAAVLRVLDQRPRANLNWGQLELDLKDENEPFSTAYIGVDENWIPGYLAYRREAQGIKIGEVKWPQKFLR